MDKEHIREKAEEFVKANDGHAPRYQKAIIKLCTDFGSYLESQQQTKEVIDLQRNWDKAKKDVTFYLVSAIRYLTDEQKQILAESLLARIEAKQKQPEGKSCPKCEYNGGNEHCIDCGYLLKNFQPKAPKEQKDIKDYIIEADSEL